MKRLSSVLLVLALAISLVAPVALAEKGPIPDKIYFDTRIKQDVAVQDVIAGKSDILYWPLKGAAVSGLSDEALEKLELYEGISGKNSLFMNPYPNKAPYYGTVEGEDVFNPFAIRDVRFALNFLINRQYVVDNILNGMGKPLIVPMIPGMPGAYKYNMIASKMGIDAQGDEDKGIEMINAAMTRASELPELKGRLKKGNEFWEFDGEPVSINFVARADDPTVRMPIASYVGQQLEKAGIKAKMLNLERSKASELWRHSDPAKLKWNMYTGGWGAAPDKWWDINVILYYSSVYGFNPGNNTPGFWNYRHEEIDKLCRAVYNGNITGLDQYWDYTLKATEMGLKESVRIWVNLNTEIYIANDDNLEGRMLAGNGLTRYSLINAKPKDGTLRVTQISSTGSLFMDEWDPIGVNGFSSTYSTNISALLDAPYWPRNYNKVEYVTDWSYVTTSHFKTKETKDEEGNRAPGLDVPEEAIMWDSKEDKWVSQGDRMSYSTTRYNYDETVWHHGMEVSLDDYRYVRAFLTEWINEDFEGDKYYDSKISQRYGGRMVDFAYIWHDDANAITTYYNYTHPSPTDVEIAGMPWDSPGKLPMPWEIFEALARMVVDGGNSGEVWSFQKNDQSTHVDLLNDDCTADIRAELIEMKDEKHIPMYLEGYTTEEEALARYEAAIKWIDEHDHALISDGPFYLYEYDMANNFAELRAFRHEKFPYEKGIYLEKWKNISMEIDNVEMPTMVEHGKDFEVTIDIVDSTYPEISKKPTTGGIVNLLFVAGDKEIEIPAEFVEPGVFKATVEGKYTEDLTADSYVILVRAGKNEDSIPDIVNSQILVY